VALQDQRAVVGHVESLVVDVERASEAAKTRARFAAREMRRIS